MKEKILITLATGKTGYAAASELLNENYEVRVYVRSRNQKALELEKMGAEIAIGEFNDFNQMLNALSGINKVYYNYPIMKNMTENVEIFINAANISRVQAIVFMGQRIAEFADTGSLMSSNTRKSYELFERSGLNVVYFLPGYFADNAFWVSEFILQLSIMANPFGNGKNPWISNADMGRCIAALLKNPEPFYGQKLFPTGPKSISVKEMAAIFSKVSGRKIWVVNAPDWLFLKAGLLLGKELGYDFFAIVQAMIYNKQMRMNRFDIEPTNIVKQLTRREPEDFETITKDYFNNSPYRIRDLKHLFSALKKFMIMPFVSTPNDAALTALNK